MSTQADLTTAVLAGLTAASVNPLTLQQISNTTPTTDYTEVTVSRRFGAAERVAGNAATVGWRITTRVVLRYAANAAEFRERSAGALEGVALGDSTPCRFETENEVEPDNGWWSGITSWTTQT